MLAVAFPVLGPVDEVADSLHTNCKRNSLLNCRFASVAHCQNLLNVIVCTHIGYTVRIQRVLVNCTRISSSLGNTKSSCICLPSTMVVTGSSRRRKRQLWPTSPLTTGMLSGEQQVVFVSLRIRFELCNLSQI